jgi:hypothetical protein
MEIAIKRGRFIWTVRSTSRKTTIYALAYEAVSSSSMERCYQFNGKVLSAQIELTGFKDTQK